MTPSNADEQIEISCGPHPFKRRGRDTWAAQAIRPQGAEGFWYVPVEPDSHWVSQQGESSFFDSDQRPSFLTDGYPSPVRYRLTLACDLCSERVTFANAAELYGILDQLQDAGMSQISLAGVRRAQQLARS